MALGKVDMERFEASEPLKLKPVRSALGMSILSPDMVKVNVMPPAESRIHQALPQRRRESASHREICSTSKATLALVLAKPCGPPIVPPHWAIYDWMASIHPPSQVRPRTAPRPGALWPLAVGLGLKKEAIVQEGGASCIISIE